MPAYLSTLDMTTLVLLRILHLAGSISISGQLLALVPLCVISCIRAILIYTWESLLVHGHFMLLRCFLLFMINGCAIFPMEVQERIIDCYGEDLNPLRDHTIYQSLLACARLCRSWTPRVRLILYRRVVLRSQPQVTSFMETIAALPWLARSIVEMTIAPRKTCYIPLILLFRQIHHVGAVNFGLDWSKYPPHMTTKLVAPGFPSVQILHLTGASFPDLSELTRLVCTFPGLSTLNLSSVEFKKEPSASEIHKVRCTIARRLPRGLRILVIEVRGLAHLDHVLVVCLNLVPENTCSLTSGRSPRFLSRAQVAQIPVMPHHPQESEFTI